MKKLFFLLCLSLFLFSSETLMAQMKESSNTTTSRQAISAVDAKFMNAWSAGNAEGIAALFTSNGMLMPPNAESVKGQSAISNFFSSLINSGVSTLKLETVTFKTHGKSCHEIGKYSVTDGNGQSVDSGKYIAILENENGQWKIQSFIYNSDLPSSMY